MPNGIDWEKVSGEKEHPLEKILPLLKQFREENRYKLYSNAYHGGLDVELSLNLKSKTGRYYIRKVIHMILVDKRLYKILHNIELQDECNDDIYCKINVYVKTHYGLKDLIFAFIPFLKSISKRWDRKWWSRTIGCLTFPIQLDKLESLLKESKQILDKFDESQLQEAK